MIADYSIPPLISATLFLACGLYLAILKHFSRESIAFLALCLTTFGWQFSWFILLNFPSLAPVLVKVGYTSIIFIPVTYYHFVMRLLFPGGRTKSIVANYLIGLVFVVLLWVGPYYINGYYNYFWGPYPRAGLLHPVYLGFLFYLAAKIVLDIARQMQKTEPYGVRHSQLRLVLVSLCIYTLASSDFLVNYGIEFYPLGFIFILGSILVLLYAVAARNLMDVSVVIKTSLLAIALFSLWLIPGIFFIYLADRLLEGLYLKAMAMAGLVVACSLLFGRIRLRAELTLDQFLNKNRYQYRQAIKQISDGLVNKYDLKELMEYLVETFWKTLEVKSVAMVLVSKDHPELSAMRGVSLEDEAKYELPGLSKIMNLVRLYRRPIIAARLESHDLLTQALRDVETEIVLPFTFRNELLGACLIGPRNFQYQYQEEDIEILEALANQIAVAIQTALAFKEIQDLNRSLDQKVKDRTRELEEALEGLKKAQAQLVQSAKMVSIGQLAAGVAHEINNPISAAGAALRKVEEEYEKLNTNATTPDALLKRIITRSIPIMKEGLSRVDHIVHALRNFSRKDRPGVNPHVKINTELEQVLLLLHSRMGDHIEVVKEYKSAQAIECNGGDINQVFMNIIGNAIEAIGDSKGEITIKTEDCDHDVLVTICDTGHGMSEETLQRIFEPFYTTKGTLGTGLGLAISYQIIKEHGGEIRVKSEMGKGSEFTILIPDQRHTGGERRGETKP